MAKEVGLKIKISSQGGEVVISNLQDLEKELTRLNNQLKTQDFGSQAFKETARNIQTLKSRIEDVDKSTEGLGVDKRLQAIAGTTNLLTGSFQALSGAVGLLSKNEDTLKQVQEAETKALQVLNVALGIRAIAEGVIQGKVLARITSEALLNKLSKSYIFTAKLLSSALNFVGINAGVASVGVRALTTSLFALGIPALIAGIGLLASKFFTLGDETKKAAEEQKNYNKAIRDLDIENIALTQGELAANRQKLIDVNNELAEIDRRQKPARQELRRIEELLQKQRRLDFTTRKKELNDNIALDEVRRKTLVNNQLSLQKAIKSTTDETNKNAEANKKANSIIAESFKRRNTELSNLINLLKEAEGVELGYTSQILEAQKKVLDEQKEFIDSRAELLKTSGEKIVEEINDFLFKTIPSLEDTKKLTDGYANLFKFIDEAVKSGQLDFRTATGWEDFVKFAETKLPGIGDSLINVNEESRKSFVEYFNSLDQRLDKIKTAASDFDLSGFLGIQGDTEDLKTLRNVEETISNLRTEAVNLGLTDLDVRQKSIKVIKEQFGIQSKIDKITKEILNNTFQIGSAETSDEIKEKLKARNTELSQTLKNYDELSKTILDGVLNTDKFIGGLRQVEVEAKKNKEEIDKLKGSIDAALSPEQFEGIKEYFKGQAGAFESILNDIFNKPQEYFDKLGKEGIKALIEGLKEGLPDITFETEQELEKFIGVINSLQIQLGESGVAGAEGYGAFNDVIVELLENLKKMKDANKEAKTDSESFLEGLTDIANKVVEAFNNISTRISNIVAGNNAILFEQLAQQEEAGLALAGDATERQREEQLKLQKEFAKKRFDLEKKARIQELQFTLANSIASGGQAVIQALGLAAPPPLPQLYALTIGGLAGIELLTIRDQIRVAQASTFVGRRGGIIQGGTHEQGGVPAMLEGGEFVMSRPAVDRFGDIVGQMNQSVGGRGLAIDDSRIVQAISSQNTSKTPIKTYVVYQDIKDTDKLNKRIEKLSRL